ncbi:hypothetical protein CYMTET_32157 [Cymbomonas tetramitiformis]|uniref:Uncharacterized protein n=1 Tax=Cymbomonas tetramitiformis TaxID=36881 RepID=A0AAE0KS70_9CHLO|nr:hypothetical protein CYMTET_32157 [Cymbomonas tetramitiformis]
MHWEFRSQYVVDILTDDHKVEAEVNAAVKEKEVEKEDPISPLDAGFSSSEEEDEEYPPVSPPVVTGKLAQLNGLWWAETPDLWRNAMDFVAKMASISAFAGVTKDRNRLFGQL